MEEVIDLTDDINEDSDDSLEITGERRLPQQPPRIPSPIRLGRSRTHHHHHHHRTGYATVYMSQNDPGNADARERANHGMHPLEFRGGPHGVNIQLPQHIAAFHHMHHHAAHHALFDQPMPINLAYNQPAFARPQQPRKPDHEPPPEAKKGFTRSPTEEDVIVCPGCEEELVAKKGEDDQPLPKKSSRAPSRKDREEHPFWVLKDCGHVCCCFKIPDHC
jgi:hypothetical protein